MTTCSCSLKVKLPTNASWSILTICLLLDKLLSCILLIKRSRSSTLLETKSRVKERSIPGIMLTVGTGILIKSNKSCICLCVFHLLVRVSDEELDSSLPWSTPQSLIGSSHGPKMP